MNKLHYLLNVVLVARRDSVGSNTRIGTGQINRQASGCNGFCVDGATFRVWRREASLVAGRRRLGVAVDCCAWWNVALRIEVLPIGIGLSDECWTSTARTEKCRLNFLRVSPRRVFYLRHSRGVILRIIVTGTRRVVVYTSIWSRRWTRLVGALFSVVLILFLVLFFFSPWVFFRVVLV